MKYMLRVTPADKLVIASLLSKAGIKARIKVINNGLRVVFIGDRDKVAEIINAAGFRNAAGEKFGWSSFEPGMPNEWQLFVRTKDNSMTSASTNTSNRHSAQLHHSIANFHKKKSIKWIGTPSGSDLANAHSDAESRHRYAAKAIENGLPSAKNSSERAHKYSMKLKEKHPFYNQVSTASLSKMTSMLKLEAAADDWWAGLSDAEKKAYITAHPSSQYNNKPHNNHNLLHHKMQVAFHQGRIDYHTNEATKTAIFQRNRKKIERHKQLAKEHQYVQGAHQAAISPLENYLESPEGARGASNKHWKNYVAQNDATKVAQKRLEMAYRHHGYPDSMIGHGYTHYDEGKEDE